MLQDPIRYHFHGHIHPHSPTRLRPPRRTMRLSDHHAAVEERGRRVLIVEGREVRVLHGDVGSEADIRPRPWGGGAVEELETVDGDSVHTDDWILDFEYGED